MMDDDDDDDDGDDDDDDDDDDDHGFETIIRDHCFLCGPLGHIGGKRDDSRHRQSSHCFHCFSLQFLQWICQRATRGWRYATFLGSFAMDLPTVRF